MAANNSRRLFDNISPVYHFLYARQRKHYQRYYKEKIDCNLSRFSSVLDVGCGSGAMASIFSDLGLRTFGVDQSLGMLRVAKRQPENHKLTLIQNGAVDGLPFRDKSFDVIIAAYMAHGIKTEMRLKLYSEMKRVGRHLAILHDYSAERSLITTVVEYAEGGDYFNFIKVIRDELAQNFGNLEVVPLEKRATCYICSLE